MYRTGIDISAEAIRQGHQKRPRIRLFQSTAEDYQLQPHENKYGMIVFNEVIYYLDHVREMLYCKLLSFCCIQLH